MLPRNECDCPCHTMPGVSHIAACCPEDIVGRAPMSTTDRNALGKVIWETSRADEQTISFTGANIVADAILASDWLAAHDAEVIEKALDAQRRATFIGTRDAWMREYAARIRRGEDE